MRNTDNRNPFKAIVAYQDKGENVPDPYFFGRDREAREILGLVQYNNIVTLYGNSSVGKTSLLNAAVFPLIRQLGYNPIRKRLETKAKISDFITELKTQSQTQSQSQSQPQSQSQSQSKSTSQSQSKEPKGVVYVIDQFEEIFKVDRQAALELLRTISRTASSKIKFIISIRQDDLYLLEEAISKLNLNQFRLNRYYLAEFDEVTARDVVTRLGYLYFPKDTEKRGTIIDKILDYVSNIGEGKLNPMLLSLICHQIWEKAQEKDSKSNKDKNGKAENKNASAEDKEDKEGETSNKIGNTEDNKAEDKVVEDKKKVAEKYGVITEKLVDKLLASENLLEDYYLDAVKDLDRHQIVWLEDRLLDKEGRRRSVDKDQIPSKLVWQELEVESNKKNPILSRADNMVEFIHDKLAYAAFTVKNRRGDGNRTFITFWCVLGTLFFVWNVYLAWNFFVTPSASQSATLSQYSFVGPAMLVILPLLWVVGLRKSRGEIIALLGGFTAFCALKLWSVDDFGIGFFYSSYVGVIQAISLIIGVLMIVYGIVKIVNRNKIKDYISFVVVLKRLWLYHTSFRVMLLVCCFSLWMFLRMLPIAYGFSYFYLTVGLLLYFTIFPKITEEIVPLSLGYVVALVIISCSESRLLTIGDRLMINSVPIVIIAVLSWVAIVLLVLKYKRTFHKASKILLSVVGTIVLFATYVITLGFNPFSFGKDFFNVYLFKHKPQCYNIVMVKSDNGLFSINAALSAEELVPPIIKKAEVRYFDDGKNFERYYVIECSKNKKVNLHSSVDLYRCEESKKELHVSLFFLEICAYNKWHFNVIDKAYYEFLDFILEWYHSDTMDFASYSPYLQALLDANLSYINSANDYESPSTSYEYIDIESGTDIETEIENRSDNEIQNEISWDFNNRENRQLNVLSEYQKPDNYIYDLRQCQGLCLSLMLDVINSNCSILLEHGFSILLEYQTLFFEDIPQRMQYSERVKLYNGKSIEFGNGLLQTYSGQTTDALLDNLSLVWENCKSKVYVSLLQQYSYSLNKIIRLGNDLKKSLNSSRSEIHTTIITDRDESTTVKLNLQSQDVSKYFDEFKQQKEYLSNGNRNLKKFTEVSLDPVYPLPKKDSLSESDSINNVGGLYLKQFNAKSNRYNLTMMLLDQIALSQISSLKNDYVTYYFNTDLISYPSPKSLMDLSAYSNEYPEINDINQFVEFNNRMGAILDSFDDIEQELNLTLMEINRLENLYKKQGDNLSNSSIAKDIMEAESLVRKRCSNAIESIHKFQNDVSSEMDQFAETLHAMQL